jgi:hypothetical protein
MSDKVFLIIKHGLYYRPEGEGYTGIKDHAGRFTADEVAEWFPNRVSEDQDGQSFVHEDDADDYSPQCYWDVKIRHELEKTRDQKSAAEHRVFELETALNEILKTQYGLQGIIEDGDDDAEAREYYMNQLYRVRGIARKVMYAGCD